VERGVGGAALEADGLGGVAHQIDDDALEDVGGEVEGRKRSGADNGDPGSSCGDALQNGSEMAQD